MTQRPWEADPAAQLKQRWGKAAIDLEPPQTGADPGCPDIWELDNGDVAVIGRDLTAAYAARLPDGVTIAHDEKLVIIPRATILAARVDIPDA